MRSNTICCLLLAVYLTSAAASRAPADTLVLAQVGKGTSKTPKYSVKNSTDDFEVRLYEPSETSIKPDNVMHLIPIRPLVKPFSLSLI